MNPNGKHIPPTPAPGDEVRVRANSELPAIYHGMRVKVLENGGHKLIVHVLENRGEYRPGDQMFMDVADAEPKIPADSLPPLFLGLYSVLMPGADKVSHPLGNHIFATLAADAILTARDHLRRKVNVTMREIAASSYASIGVREAALLQAVRYGWFKKVEFKGRDAWEMTKDGAELLRQLGDYS